MPVLALALAPLAAGGCGGRLDFTLDRYRCQELGCDGNAGPDAGDAPASGAPDASSPLGDAAAPDAGPASPATTPPTEYADYLANAAHTNAVYDTTLTPPLVMTWTQTLGQPVSYPLIVGDQVFVAMSAVSGKQAGVEALSLSTGALEWASSTLSASTPSANIAYEGGRLFAVDTGPSGSVRAFDAATGTLLWQRPLDPGQTSFAPPPVAYEGSVYVTGEGGPAGTLYAYAEASGQLQWSASFDGVSAGSAAVSMDGAFVFDTCGEARGFGLDGTPAWTDVGPCLGGVGPPVVEGSALYTIHPDGVNARLDLRTGANVGSFVSDLPPAFGGGRELDVSGGVVRARSPGTGAVAWTFEPDGEVVAPPLYANGRAYVASSLGNLYAIDTSSGDIVWWSSTGAWFGGQPSFGMAAAHGTLVVPTTDGVTAYLSAGASYDPGTRIYGGAGGGCVWGLGAGVVSSPTAATPAAMAVADVDGDGVLDVATAGSAPGAGLAVMRGHGDGHFQALASSGDTFGEGASALVLGDVDGDHHVDAILASARERYESGNEVLVAPGHGDGTFGPPAFYAGLNSPVALALIRPYGSGVPDALPSLLVGDADGEGLQMMPNGGTAFGAPGPGLLEGDVAALAVADVNGDGRPDVVAASSYPGGVTVLLGNDARGFQPAVATADSAPTSAVAVGDLNGDGKPDVVAITDRVVVMLGNGDGTFGQMLTYTAGVGPTGIAIGDLDADGRPDLVVTDGTVGSVGVLFNAGHGVFQDLRVYSAGGGSFSPVVADFDGDGQLDVAVCNAGDGTVEVRLGTCSAAGP